MDIFLDFHKVEGCYRENCSSNEGSTTADGVKRKLDEVVERVPPDKGCELGSGVGEGHYKMSQEVKNLKKCNMAPLQLSTKECSTYLLIISITISIVIIQLQLQSISEFYCIEL